MLTNSRLSSVLHIGSNRFDMLECSFVLSEALRCHLEWPESRKLIYFIFFGGHKNVMVKSVDERCGIDLLSREHKNLRNIT